MTHDHDHAAAGGGRRAIALEPPSVVARAYDDDGRHLVDRPRGIDA
jgi:hypothetical protein